MRNDDGHELPLGGRRGAGWLSERKGAKTCAPVLGVTDGCGCDGLGRAGRRQGAERRAGLSRVSRVFSLGYQGPGIQGITRLGGSRGHGFSR